MMTLLSRWFHPSAPALRPSSNDYLLLALIVGAGAWVRFWGLGYPGLHGDEDIMGLAARGLLEEGSPVLPSGMMYVRALLHTYIIAGSIWLFGESEWAMRFPSAVVGSLVPVLAFLMGRRFLEPKLNLVFAAVMAFLPALIEYSQTARMYIFFVAGLLVFGALLFKWEETGKTSWLAATIAMWLLSLHIHSLAAFAAPLFLYPGLSKQSWRRLLEGIVALGIAFVAYLGMSTFQRGFYPDEDQRLEVTGDGGAAPLELLLGGPIGWVLLLGAAALALVIAAGFVGIRRRQAMLGPAALVALGVAACTLLHYHVGVTAILLGVIFWFRAKEVPVTRLLPAFVVLTVMAAVQLIYLHGTGEFVGRQIIGAIRFSTYSPAAVAVYLAVLAFAAVRFARGEPLPVHFLLFAVGVWVPLLAIGVFTWNAPPRYMVSALPFFLLCVLAGLAYLFREGSASSRVLTSPAAVGTAVLLLTLAVVNPLAVAVTASNDYRNHPDHKGAAEFVRSLNRGPADLLIAEDAINQTYYLGHVDYHLVAYDVASRHAVAIEGQLLDQYTGTPTIGTGEQLMAILEAHTGGDVYIIGSGENFADGRQQMRGHGIQEVLDSDRFKILYEGRDGRTRVWRTLN